jgi:(1->4)-alpha-D-glucan 1-alpha-D-glucosylmutase
LQLRKEFGFRDAAALAPYLAALGVSHVYCSPILQAAPGSTHGYDVVDHSRLSDELGGDEGWAELVETCRAHGLGIVVDIVPNHMTVPDPPELNRQWADVLAKGRSSSFAHWFDIDWAESDRTGELVYRRFFDVSSLIGVRVEEPDVFEATHERVLALVRRGDVAGLRIDHPDGLADPRGYLERLREEAGDTWTVVEKILEPGEQLPSGWQCQGTTGYDAILAITHALLDPAGCAALTALYEQMSGGDTDYEAVVEQSKRDAVERVLVPEVERLVREITPIAAGEFTPDALRPAIQELLVGFDVYRAYADEHESLERIKHAAARARAAAPDSADAIDWLAAKLLTHCGSEALEGAGSAMGGFATRFEQTTGPVMAKGVEDTAFYRYFRLSALNEVGGNPGAFGLSSDEWHDHCRRIARDWPHTMTTLTTHDTKRSEDVRARLLVLAEIPGEWSEAVARWRATADASYPSIDGNTDYLFWQTLVGAWPLTVDRMHAYLEKAMREAKRQTSWIDQNEEYEGAVRERTARIFADPALVADVEQWVDEHLSGPGQSNVLAQKLLQLTMPGVPDVYQGQELTEPALVDPDNRRPVDYDERRRRLDVVDNGEGTPDVKLLVTARTLRLRRDRPTSFAGAYTPISADGAAADHVLAYTRGDDVAVVVTRFPARIALGNGWEETTVTLPPGDWVDVLTGNPANGTLRLADTLGALPVALLARLEG